MTTKVKAIVLKSIDYKEKDRLITLFSLENGKMLCSLRGVKSPNAKLKFAKEPFCFGEFVIENTKGKNIITQVEVIDSFFNLTSDIDRYYEGCAILDVVGKISSENQDAALFIELLKALKCLSYENPAKYYVFDKFLIKIFESSGYYFLSQKCSSCKYDLSDARYFNLDVGEFVCSACKNDLCIKVSNAAFAGLRLLAQTDYERLKLLHLGGGAEKEIYSLLDKNFEFRFGKRFCQII